ncbi:uncharacterized protein EV154DRAFT_478526 [Mucor mucedo]|uniref:uncharacterized protein n=1 Tax=Mucor mucedo TaxID=29922 RepID=UPI00221F415F|nr:uncharacterized protein EV154DRAFT_478526 [Mucor mucedo]KAI7894279.1 hypothetical protein EV154DRAFT_478526 [Mucor mucedo]
MTFRFMCVTSLAVLLVWLQLVQAYCVYNYLDNENSSVYVEEESAPSDVSFKKTIGHGGKECCPYDNSECNPRGNKKSHVNFKLVFNFGDGVAESGFSGECVGGGGLAFYGTSLSDMKVYCSHPDGIQVQFQVKRPFLLPMPVPFTMK